MRWFKHMSASHSDDKMMELIEEHGAAGYGLWWFVLELIAEQMDGTGRCSVKIGTKRLPKLLQMRSKRARNVLETCTKLNLLMTEVVTSGRKEYYILTCANLLKYRDEATRKRAREHTKFRSDTGPTPALDLDIEIETEKKSRVKKKPPLLETAKEFISEFQKLAELVPDDVVRCAGSPKQIQAVKSRMTKEKFFRDNWREILAKVETLGAPDWWNSGKINLDNILRNAEAIYEERWWQSKKDNGYDYRPPLAKDI